MAKTLKDLYTEFRECTERSRAIMDGADKEQRKRSGEEDEELRKLDTRMSDLEPEIEKLSKLEERERKVNTPRNSAADLRGQPSRGEDDEERALVGDYHKRFDGRVIEEVGYDFKKTGTIIAQQMANNPLSTRAYAKAFRRWLASPPRRGNDASSLTPEEQRALSVGTATEGGYTVPAEEFVAELIKTLDNEAVLRGLSRTFTIPQALSLGAPTLSADPADPDWTTELGTGSEDSTMAFGKRSLNPWPIAKRLKVSDKLLRASPLGMAGIVQERLAYKLAVAHSTAFNTGDGASKPLGIYVASANGIDTDRDKDVSSSNAYTADGFIDARYTLRSGYWPNARWHFHRNMLAQVRKLKQSSTNDYLWQPGMTVGAPNTFLDFPYSVDEYAPSTVTGITAQYVAILGNFQYYWIVDALSMSIRRLDELYAETNQVGFIIRAETDAQPVLSDAFVRCKATIS